MSEFGIKAMSILGQNGTSGQNESEFGTNSNLKNSEFKTPIKTTTSLIKTCKFLKVPYTPYSDWLQYWANVSLGNPVSTEDRTKFNSLNSLSYYLEVQNLWETIENKCS